ncbi:hypothetical protein JG687_00014114 [Phytophthora cactorum]|uniref:Uncharacterized protein n=1 Tax=Phytophthora cactorum TaxID=29920 RepID=A0A329RJI9_9STRA|nr:hypothetical protein Pcac1_g9900 [Phytophthora cactorum]KAG2801485.1 hypothetical protein PC112_g20021 [Phytophthora cactorum]KAG2801903.1 hypothetical protein PC111_g19345 [Phytophthora cactorum]KAG2837120.1 hypothetical protein PC113_g19897 [Phytophthora cactorum]KAG2880880.1 hypothetical protein PC114_g21850 [Phytophthora cactorum]
MAPKISSVLGFHERDQLHKNASILAYTGDVGQNYLDLGDRQQEGEQNTTNPPRRRNTIPEKKKTTASSRLSSLSSSLNSARSAVASRAKKLHVRESTLQAISQLRKSMVKGHTSRAQHSQSSLDSVPPQHESNQCDNDHFVDLGNQAGVENAGYECMYAEVSLGNDTEFTSRGSTATKSRLSRLLPPRPPWIKSFKQARRFSDELY